MAKQAQTGHFKFWSLPISLSLNLPISIALCNSQGSILRKVANSSVMKTRVNIELGEDLFLGLDGAPIAALDDQAILVAT